MPLSTATRAIIQMELDLARTSSWFGLPHGLWSGIGFGMMAALSAGLWLADTSFISAPIFAAALGSLVLSGAGWQVMLPRDFVRGLPVPRAQLWWTHLGCMAALGGFSSLIMGLAAAPLIASAPQPTLPFLGLMVLMVPPLAVLGHAADLVLEQYVFSRIDVSITSQTRFSFAPTLLLVAAFDLLLGLVGVTVFGLIMILPMGAVARRESIGRPLRRRARAWRLSPWVAGLLVAAVGPLCLRFLPFDPSGGMEPGAHALAGLTAGLLLGAASTLVLASRFSLLGYQALHGERPCMGLAATLPMRRASQLIWGAIAMVGLFALMVGTMLATAWLCGFPSDSGPVPAFVLFLAGGFVAASLGRFLSVAIHRPANAGPGAGPIRSLVVPGALISLLCVLLLRRLESVGLILPLVLIAPVIPLELATVFLDGRKEK